MNFRIIMAAAAVLSAGCAWSVGAYGPNVHEQKVIELDSAERTRFRLEMGGGELEVTGGSARLLEAEFTYNVPDWKPTVVQTASGDESRVGISQRTTPALFGHTENRWKLALNDARPIDLSARLVAGEARMLLGSLNLRDVDVYVGAGEAEVDLRGTPKSSYRVKIHGGVGEATVYVPNTVAISATASGAIGEIKVTGLERRGGRWINPHVESGPVVIDLDVQGGIGEIRIVAGPTERR